MTGRGGYSLLEATVALVLVSLVSVAVLQSLAVATSAGRRGNDAAIKEALFQDRAASLDMLSLPLGLDLPDSIAGGTFPPPFDTYGWTLAADRIRSRSDLLLVTITLTTPVGTDGRTVVRYAPIRSAEAR